MDVILVGHNIECLRYADDIILYCVQKKHPLLFSCITLRKSNKFE